MKLLTTVGLALCLVAFAVAQEKKAFDAAKMVGDWTYESGMRAGDNVDKARLASKVAISKETFTLAGPDGNKFVMAYKLDAKATPVTIDLDIKSGPVNEGKAEGIISLDGDELKLCYVPQGAGKRPTKFESTKDNGAFYFVLKRAK